MLPIKPSKQSLICLGVAVVLLLVVLCFAYYELASRVHGLDVQIAEKSSKLENSQQIARRLSAVEQQYSDAEMKLSALEQGVSTKAYVPTLLRQVEELGKGVNLRVIGVRPRDTKEKPSPQKTADGKETVVKKVEPYDRLEIDMEMSGKYADVMRYVYGITSFPKIIAVNTIEMKPVSDPSEIASPMLSVTMNTTAFILKDTAAKPTNSVKQTAQAAAVGRT